MLHSMSHGVAECDMKAMEINHANGQGTTCYHFATQHGSRIANPLAQDGTDRPRKRYDAGASGKGRDNRIRHEPNFKTGSLNHSDTLPSGWSYRAPLLQPIRRRTLYSLRVADVNRVPDRSDDVSIRGRRRHKHKCRLGNFPPPCKGKRLTPLCIKCRYRRVQPLYILSRRNVDLVQSGYRSNRQGYSVLQRNGSILILTICKP